MSPAPRSPPPISLPQPLDLQPLSVIMAARLAQQLASAIAKLPQLYTQQAVAMAKHELRRFARFLIKHLLQPSNPAASFTPLLELFKAIPHAKIFPQKASH
ncbi:hypothetical protein Vafri_15331 [Volvox africanus]|uniref:Uncharacterized protein n=1 Tax=Volvox africanus TaxID=51714 RepID=A0A8J4F5D4_9CHLO|nr:hypothetical protein Vafri_15331 [Volvox africanus]